MTLQEMVEKLLDLGTEYNRELELIQLKGNYEERKNDIIVMYNNYFLYGVE
mgnify:CR=1 FL=1